jgi:hypothetical protein
VSSSARREDGGHHVASVSIRSGRGSMTHDRVLRFSPVFRSRAEALAFAARQAHAWIDGQSRDPAPAAAE